MADQLDIVEVIADSVTTAINAVVGTTVNLPYSTDAAVQGPIVVPNTTVFTGTIVLTDIMNRLESGKASIGIEFDEAYAPADQYLTNGLDYDPTVIPTPALTIVQNGPAVTIGGLIQLGDVIGAYVGAKGTGVAVQVGDTFALIATRLATALTAAGIPSTAVGAVLTVATGQVPVFNVGASWTRQHESWRRRKLFYATLWAPSMWTRSILGKQVETVFEPSTRLSLPDGTMATLLSFDSIDLDEQQRDMTYIRKCRWLFDFIATRPDTVTQVVGPAFSATAVLPGGATTFTSPLAAQL